LRDLKVWEAFYFAKKMLKIAAHQLVFSHDKLEKRSAAPYTHSTSAF
jgi:hypothetical protein